MLSAETNTTREAVAWGRYGRTFQILDDTKLRHYGVLQFYFGYNKVERFKKELQTHGYKKLTSLGSGDHYYSEVRGDLECKYL